MTLFRPTLAAIMLTASASSLAAGNVMPPEGAKQELQVYARGVQLYRCAAPADNASTGSWIFQAPEADLFSDKAMTQLVGKHYDGPHWVWLDGSILAGKLLTSQDSPHPGAIPWLLLEGTSTGHAGRLTGIHYIQRVDTVDGNVGNTRCDASRYGMTLNVPYTATYRFWR
ncbi:hypothetical protein ED28_15970 [[Pantoea] beijingensis]|uniref:DUF3455 domain-containing protein n=1 Tax=[Pantoea] beijingensis TaxID=1324864 RepID=A0A443IAK8_9GAMM|nr:MULTISPECIES: DUF3455 domain-containing protein [Erwiniaceae]RWR00946.1 hypothetical protein ED28_15970 [[Pantoea] beijingensis]